MVKTCSSCKKEKSFSEFHRRGSNGYQSICKLCRATDDQDRYLRTAKHHSAVRSRRRAALIVWSQTLKEGRPCADCGGVFHPIAMQWDHVGTDKKINVADAVKRGWSKARILAEIAKCELVCSNCHAIRTWQRRRERDVA
jgi:hypothetical protein